MKRSTRPNLYQAILQTLGPASRRAYESHYRDFAKHRKARTPAAALDALLACKQGDAFAIALSYRDALISRKLATSTVSVRLCALRTACKVGRSLGLINWSLEVEIPRAVAYRDTTGPGRDGWTKLLATARSRATTPRGRRDLAIVRLLHDLALRRFEAGQLDLAHVDLERGVVSVLRKKRKEREQLTLPAPTRAVLADWIAARGTAPGPLFFRLDHDADASRHLGGESIRRIVMRLGKAAGLARPVRPHGLRHQAITHALDITSGDVRAVQKFSGHKKLETLLIYDDNRQDVAGAVAARVASE